jgi:hypothetical protein
MVLMPCHRTKFRVFSGKAYTAIAPEASRLGAGRTAYSGHRKIRTPRLVHRHAPFVWHGLGPRTRLYLRRHARTARLYPPQDEQNEHDEHDGAKYAADVHVLSSSVSMGAKTRHGLCATEGHEPLAHNA